MIKVMIQANELRIGNILEFDRIFWKVDEILKTKIIAYYNPYQIYSDDEAKEFNKSDTTEEFPYGDLQPVPICKEILLKCGFLEVGIYKNVYHKDDFRVIIGDIGCVLQISKDECCIELELHSLHHFQNLYFALTGKELVVNL